MSKKGGWWQGPALVMMTALAIAGVWGVRTITQATAGGGWDMPPETVLIVTAEARPWRDSATLLATLSPIASVDLRTEVGGRLVEVGFESGVQVARGAVIARLDSAVEEAELRSVEAEVRALTLRRDRVAQVDATTARMELDQAGADVEAAAARADALRARIRQKVVLAPFAGRTGMRTLHPGQVVDPGVLLTSIVSTSTGIYADGWVPQTLVPSITAGGAVLARLGTATVPATIEVLESQADPTRRAVRMRARVDPAPPGWLPSMSVQVEIPIGGDTMRVVVPATALVFSPAGTLVYRVEPGEGGEKVAAAPVEVLANLGDEVVLASGLDAGARIVAEGAFKLHEGSAVKAAEGESALKGAVAEPDGGAGE